MVKGMSLYNNNWWRIHDFTPSTDEKNFSWIEDTPGWLTEFASAIPAEPAEGGLASVGYDIGVDAAVVPLTLGPHPKPATESCLVVVFKPLHAKKMLGAVRRAADLKPDTTIAVAQTKESRAMSAEDAARVFAGDGNAAYAEAAQKGAVIGIEFNGDGAVAAARAASATIGNGLVFVSADADGGASIVEAFFTYMDMQLKI